MFFLSRLRLYSFSPRRISSTPVAPYHLSRQAFKKAAHLHKSRREDIPAALWNNIGVLALRLGKVDEARIALVHAAKAAGATWPLPELNVHRLTVVPAKDNGTGTGTATGTGATGTGATSSSATGTGDVDSNTEDAGAGADDASAPPTVIGVAHVTAYFNLARCLELAGDLAAAAQARSGCRCGGQS